jgi:hypothetical protein
LLDFGHRSGGFAAALIRKLVAVAGAVFFPACRWAKLRDFS